MATRAEDQGGDSLLNGRKLWITNAAEAGFFLLFANANPGGHQPGTVEACQRLSLPVALRIAAHRVTGKGQQHFA